MKIFVLGTSYSGKTPLAERLGARLGLPVHSAGEWAREGFGHRCRDMREYVAEVTAWSLAELQTDFGRGLKHLRGKEGLSDGSVIEGERNPHDFVHLFDPRAGWALTLVNLHNPIPPTPYEHGLEVIWRYLEWLAANGFIMASQDLRYSFDCLYRAQRESAAWVALEDRIDAIVDEVESAVRAFTLHPRDRAGGKG
jgi:hypothetical protein